MLTNKSRIILFYFSIACLSLFLSSLRDEPRYINDGYDMDIYQTVGTWLPEGEKPYKDVFSPYPQLATYLFALPYALTDHATDPYIYRYIFSLLMDLFLATMIVMIYQYRAVTKNLAFLLLLPACLYFSHNRFDIVPSFLVLVSLLLLFNGKYYSAFVSLALSVMFKWYAVVLFPVYLSYCRSQRDLDIRYLLAAFALPVAAISLHSMIWSGWKDFFNPYLFHLGRGANRESIAWFFEVIFGPILEKNLDGLIINIIAVTFYSVFLVAQFIVAFLALFAKIDDKEKVIYWSVASIAGFMLFAKYYSPQWILWITPLLLLMPVNRKLVILIILFDIFTYLEFPIFFGYRKGGDILLFSAFYFMVLIRIGILFYLFRHAFSSIRQDIRLPFSGSKQTAVA